MLLHCYSPCVYCNRLLAISVVVVCWFYALYPATNKAKVDSVVSC